LSTYDDLAWLGGWEVYRVGSVEREGGERPPQSGVNDTRGVVVTLKVRKLSGRFGMLQADCEAS
jgi:hypothetical protein